MWSDVFRLDDLDELMEVVHVTKSDIALLVGMDFPFSYEGTLAMFHQKKQLSFMKDDWILTEIKQSAILERFNFLFTNCGKKLFNG